MSSPSSQYGRRKAQSPFLRSISHFLRVDYEQLLTNCSCFCRPFCDEHGQLWHMRGRRRGKRRSASENIRKFCFVLPLCNRDGPRLPHAKSAPRAPSYRNHDPGNRGTAFLSESHGAMHLINMSASHRTPFAFFRVLRYASSGSIF